MADIKYERWNGEGDLLNIVDNRTGRYDKFFADTEGKRKMVAATGANGIMEIREAPKGEDYAYHVVFHTGLGLCGEVPLCGNGSRCTVAYACTYGIVPRKMHNNFQFLAGDGVHDGSFVHDENKGEYFVTISMRDIKNIVKISEHDWFANSGSAHFVRFMPLGSIKSVDVMAEGRKLSKEIAYLAPDLAVLVNFVEDWPEGVLCRCYDTGMDGEILACGTASTCIAVIHASYKAEADGKRRKVVRWENGKIAVGYKKKGDQYTEVTLQSKVFCEVKGTYHYEYEVEN